MNSYARFINELYDVLSGTWGDHFIGIDETLEEVPPSAEYVIRPSFNFGTTTSMSNLRDIENDVIVNLQLFKAHDSQVDIVEQAEMIKSRLLHVTVFTIDDQKYWTTYRNLVKNFDSKYTGVTVQILAKKYEEVQETPIDWTTRPLTFIAAEPNTKIIIRRYGTGIISTSIKYKFNIDDEWQNYTPGDEITLTKIGDMVMFENTSSSRFSYDTNNYFNVESTGNFYAKGQIHSLTNYQQPYNYSFYKLFDNNNDVLSTPIFPSGTLVSHVYDSMFKSCSNLVEAESLIVPNQINDSQCREMFMDCVSLKKIKVKFDSVGASMCYQMFENCVSLKELDMTLTESVNVNCFYRMFYNCASLEKAPVLPATTLSGRCYYAMFQQCINLKEVPDLPATTLDIYCYQSMFSGCKRIKKTGQLNFTNAPNYCCQNMFQNCISLEEGPSALLPEVVEIGAYDYMFQGCSLLKEAPEIYGRSFNQYALRAAFQNCTSLIKAPSTLSGVLTGPTAFNATFYGCTSLTKAPEIYFPTATNNCCQTMFQGCTSLIQGPSILPATTLATQCYYQMFLTCRSLEKAPELPAPTLTTNCYAGMFQNCSSLNEIKCGATSWGNNTTSVWVQNVSPSGTFICPSSLPNIRGNNNIPNNWTKTDI